MSAEELEGELRSLPLAEAERRIASRVTRALSDFLGIPEEDIASDASFLDLGFDSLRAVDFKDDLAARFGCELRTTLVFDHPTPVEVTTHLMETLGLTGAAENTPAVRADDLDSLSADELRARLRAIEEKAHEPIAIVGVACRLPGGSNTPEAYWELLRTGGDAITEIPAERFPIDILYDPDHRVPGKIATRYGAFIDDIDRFDAGFFGMAPREARELDPRQRVLMEVAWEAVERGAISPDKLHGRAVGVYVGILSHEYYDSQSGRDLTQCGQYNATGGALSTAAGRLSHHFGWTGPSLALDTACSSSLVAVHLAVQSIRSGECEMAMAAGANALLDPVSFLGISQANMLAADGRCKTFDAKGDGYVRSEGVGAMLLKPLSKAQADGDRIFGVILGTASNQDGASGGLTVPHGPSQVAVIKTALEDARVEPREISYIEAHGTGTSLGDPIEIGAIDEVFGASHGGRGLLVGSVKTNIGHGETVAGFGGLLKLVLALQNEAIPRNLHFETPNPHVPWDRSVVRVPTQNIPWPRGDERRIAGISSFGFSGTNAHVVLAEAPATAASPASEEPRRPFLLPISAGSPEALRELIGLHADALSKDPDDAARCADHCATTAIGRAALPHRATFVANSGTELVQELRDAARDETIGVRGDATGRSPGAAFLFTGQGSQFAGMARELYEAEPAFRAALDACADALAPHLARPLFDVLWGDDAAELIDQTHFTQPALFAVEVALARMWRAFGVEPTVMLGHSIGEIAAAHVAGVFSLEDGAKLIAARGRLMTDETPPGDMLVVFGSEAEVAPFLVGREDKVSIAAANGPANTVISGDAEVLRTVADELAELKLTTTPLAVSRAFHSPLMEPMLAAFEAVARSITYSPPQIPIVSCLEARVVGEEMAGADFWIRHVRAPVRFQAAMECLRTPSDGSAAPDAMIELGPQPILLGMARRLPKAEGTAATAMIPSLRKGPGDWGAVAAALADAFALGLPVDWSAALAGDPRPRVDVPTHPFHRERYWYERRPQGATTTVGGAAPHPLLGARLSSAALDDGAILYRGAVSAHAPALLAEHVVFGGPIVPAAGLVEMALAAATRVSGDEVVELTGLAVREALPVGDAETALELILDAPSGESEDERAFRICSLPPVDPHTGDGASPDWVVHATGTIGAPNLASRAATLDRSRVSGDGWAPIAPEAFYAAFADAGLDYGPAFRGIRELSARHAADDGDRSEAFAHVRLSGDAAEGGGYRVHPALLDACFQSAAAALVGLDISDLFLPIGIERLCAHAAIDGEVWCHTVVTEGTTAERSVRLDLRLYAERDDALALVLEVEGLQLVRADAASLARTDGAARRLLHTIQWRAGARDESAEPLADDVTVALVAAESDAPSARVATAVLTELEGRGRSARIVTGAEIGNLTGSCAIAWLVGLDAIPELESDLIATAADDVRAAIGRDGATTITFVTRGAQPAGGAMTPAGSVLWGFANALALEHPELSVRRIDLDVAGEDAHEAEAAWLADELTTPDAEDRVALRGDERRVARLVRLASLAAAELAAPGAEFELRARDYGSLDNLMLRPITRRSPAAGEVEVEVDAAALNFKDVLHTLGMLRSWSEERGIHAAPDQPLGFEAAGTIVQAGDDLSYAVGDRVIVSWPGALATHLTVPADACMPQPDGLDSAEAAGLPTVFQTALYGLERCAKLQAGERVLIHAAAGGVGQAAVQVARRAGAVIFATASPGKHAFLKGQGIAHVFNSRTLDFSAEVRALTDGRGVDVVLNSLAGDFVDASLDCLAEGGRFIEIGKIGVKTDDEMAAARPDVDYHLFDLSETMAVQPSLLPSLRKDIAEGFADGGFQALPTTRFTATRAVEAFRALAQATQIGKIALTMPASEVAASRVRDDRSYLITGGLGALGRVVARRLVTDGARHLVLCGRSGIDDADDATQADIAALEADGVTVHCVAADVSERAGVQRILDEITASLPPLAGVVHCAGVLDDATVQELSADSIRRVLEPKVAGLRNLNDLLRDTPLDFFVAFSSMAAPIGAQGQAAYGAANAALDAMCSARKASGQPALSIQWGPWSGGGMASDLSARDQVRLAERGLGSIAPEEGAALFTDMLGRDRAEIAVLPIQWPKFLRAFPRGGPPPMFEAFAVATTDAGGDEHAGLREQLRAASPEELTVALAEFLEGQLVRVLGFPPSTAIDPRKGFTDLGVDSLLAVDLRNRIESALDTALPATLLFDHPNLESLVAFLADEVAATMPGTAEEAPDPAAELAELSEDEIARRLAAEIDALSE